MNDTTEVTLYSSLCGLYTIGGVSPDFVNFTEAVTALNNAGVTCGVTFRVRNGVYNEQVQLGQVNGASAAAPIVFESERGDSTAAVLHYQAVNTVKDYTLALTGTNHVTFRKLGVLRSNGERSVLIEGGAHHVGFLNNKLGHVYSPATSLDSALVFRRNDSGSIVLLNSGATPATGIVVEGNVIASTLANSYSGAGVDLSGTRRARVVGNTITSNVNATANNGYCAAPSGYGVRLANSPYGLVSANVISSSSRNYYNNCGSPNSYGLGIDASDYVVVSNNTATALTGRSQGLELSSSSHVQVTGNTFTLTGGGSNPSVTGLDLGTGTDVLAQGNTAVPALTSQRLVYGMRSSGGNARLIGNTLTRSSAGIVSSGAGTLVQANVVQDVLGNGIDVAEGTGQKVLQNRVSQVNLGTGVLVSAGAALVANNFVQVGGPGTAVGISLGAGASAARVVFNSVNVTGTDVASGRALELTAALSGLTVKNNVFANNGAGYAAYVAAAATGTTDWDYNDYYSASGKLGFYSNTALASLSAWQQATGKDPNGKTVNPFYKTITELRPQQRALNGAAIASSGVTLDIDGELRNGSAPDPGGDEFTVDFGITRLISPTLDCNLGPNDKVTVNIAQYGDIPLLNLKVAYRVNKGPIYTDVIPGSTTNDIEYTFQQPQDLSVGGTYSFKIWLVDANDDNINNDTLYVDRFKKPSPIVNFTYLTDCATKPITFTGSASVGSGSIARYEWLFGDGESASVRSPVHVFARSGIYTVTMRAYSNEGCYSAMSKAVTVTETPVAAFTTDNTCQGSAVTFTNESTIGAGSMSYSWKFGDGQTSTAQHPSHTYARPGTYKAELTTTGSAGCSTSTTALVTVYPTPVVTTTPTGTLTIASGGKATLKANDGFVSYRWSDGQPNQEVVMSTAGTYTVTVTDKNGCQATSAPVTVQLAPMPVVNLGADVTMCEGQSKVFNAGAGFSSYKWSTGATTSSITVTAAGTYSLTVEDAYGQQATDEVVVVVTALSNVSFTGLNATYCVTNGAVALTGSPAGGTFSGPGIVNGTSFAPSTAGAGTHTVTYRYTNASGCQGTATQTVTVTPVLAAPTASGAARCGTGSVTLRASGSSGTYAWYATATSTAVLGTGANFTTPSLTANTTYYVQATAAQGCASNRVPVAATINAAPVVSASATSSSVCAGTSTALQAQGASTYTWFPATGLSNTSGAAVTASPATTTTYTVTGTSAQGCQSTATVTVTVTPALAVTAQAAPATVPAGSTVALSVTSPVSGATYTWNGANLAQTSGASVTARPTATGTYPYTVTATKGGCSVTSSVQVTVTTSTITWTGNTSTAWATAANWSNNQAPTAADEVTIPAGRPFSPEITGTQAIGTVRVEAGARLAVKTIGVLEVRGDFFNSGTFSSVGLGEVRFTGPAIQRIGGASTTTFNNLLIGGAGVQLQTPASVERLLTLTSNLTTNNHAFTLLSSSNGTAMVVNTGGEVFGNATMQRSLTQVNPGAGYRHYSSPVRGTTVADFATPGFTPRVNAAFNVLPTPKLALANFPNVLEFDERRISPAYPGFDIGWKSPVSLSAPLVPGSGYSVNIDAKQTVDLTGTLNNGPVTVSNLTNGGFAKSGWHMLGNPYPAPIDWDLVNLPTGLGSALYIYRSAGPYTGAYISYVNGVGPVGADIVAPMQGFLVRNFATGPVDLTFTNACRLTTYASPLMDRGHALRPLLELTLQDARHRSDAAYVYFESGATPAFDRRFDASKVLNSDSRPNLFSALNGQNLAINGLGELPQTTVVPLGLAVTAPGASTLQAAQLANFPTATQVLLEDRKLNVLHDLRQATPYAFTYSTADSVGRFFLRFLPVVTAAQSTQGNFHVSVYPTPTTGHFTVELNQCLGPVRIELLNAIGQRMMTHSITGNGQLQRMRLDGSYLATGVYVVQVHTRNGVVTQKLIKE